MKKNFLRGYIVLFLVFLVYSVTAALFPKNAVFWIAYGFSVIAAGFQIYMINVVLRNEALIRERIYEFPMIRISVLYLITQFNASFVLMWQSERVSIKVECIVETLIFAVFVISFFAAGATRKEVERQEVQHRKDLSKMKDFQARANFLAAQCADGGIKLTLQKLTEELKYSDPVSKDNLEDIENELSAVFDEVESAAIEGDGEITADLCSQMISLLKERNRLCKYGK